MLRREEYRLRPLVEQDLQTVLEWRNSDRVRSQMFRDGIIAIDEHRVWFEKLKVDESSRHLVFEHREIPLGLIYFTGIDSQKGTCTWGFYLGMPNLPRGTGTTMGILGIEYAFSRLGIKKIQGECLGFNLPGIKYHKKMGFIREGSQHVLRNGVMEEVISFMLSRESWIPMKQQLEKTLFLEKKEHLRMNDHSNTDSQLMERATSTKNLSQRANVNQQYGTGDFEGWVDALLDRIPFSNVLDICCGTGNQLVKYAARSKAATLTGADISEKSLATADKRLKEQGANRFRLIAVSMEDLFQAEEVRGKHYDLISCFYGLYYSKNPLKTLTEMIGHLSQDGTILIVGPYGRNNAALFDILQKYFTLPELVTRSSSTFMEQEVFPVLSASLTVSVNTFVNPVRYPNPQVVVDYWKSSTFYSEAHREAVTRDIEAHFEKHGGFVMEKHVMAYLARKI